MKLLETHNGVEIHDGLNPAVVDAPYVGGRRTHDWLWLVTALYHSREGEMQLYPEPRLQVAGEQSTRESAIDAARQYADRGYSSLRALYVIEPRYEAPQYKTTQEVVKAAELIPKTLYTIDCPICGIDVMEQGSEYSHADASEVTDWLWCHLEDYHPELADEDDE